MTLSFQLESDTRHKLTYNTDGTVSVDGVNVKIASLRKFLAGPRHPLRTLRIDKVGMGLTLSLIYQSEKDGVTLSNPESTLHRPVFVRNEDLVSIQRSVDKLLDRWKQREENEAASR